MRRGSNPSVSLAVLALALTLGGCARIFGSHDIARSGLSRPDEHLRRLLAAQQADSAGARLARQEGAPADELLRLLYSGVVAHYAGRYEESATALDRAAALAEDRYTRSLTRGALSLVSSDLALAYQPSRTERLLIHYYGTLNYLRRNDLEEAAVEARRLSQLLQAYEESGVDEALRGLHGILHSFAGAAFEAAGEHNDADVAHRRALALSGDAAAAVPPAEAARSDSAGQVIVVLEEGFVAHRVEQELVLVLLPEDVAGLAGGDEAGRTAAAADVAARVLAQAFRAAGESEPGEGRPRRLMVTLPAGQPQAASAQCRPREGAQGGGPGQAAGGAAPAAAQAPDSASNRACPKKRERNPYFLKIAWPVYRSSAPREHRAAAIVVDSAGAAPVQLAGDVSRAAVQEFQQQRALLLARLVARAASKLALTRAVEREAGEEKEALGRVLGLVTNLGTLLLERADTRSWHLLPGRVGVARLRLPPGRHTVTVVLDAAGERSGRRLELGTIDLRPLEIRFLTARLWH